LGLALVGPVGYFRTFPGPVDTPWSSTDSQYTDAPHVKRANPQGTNLAPDDERPETDEDDELIPLAEPVDGRGKATLKRRNPTDKELDKLARNTAADDLLPLPAIDWQEWSRNPLTR
jgi:hypothetical protein